MIFLLGMLLVLFLTSVVVSLALFLALFFLPAVVMALLKALSCALGAGIVVASGSGGIISAGMAEDTVMLLIKELVSSQVTVPEG